MYRETKSKRTDGCHVRNVCTRRVCGTRRRSDHDTLEAWIVTLALGIEP